MEEHAPEDPEILKKIQEAEVKVGQMNLQAMVESRQILQQAREQAEQLLQVRRREAEQASMVLLQERIVAAEQEAAVIIEKARFQTKEIQERAVTQMEAAVELILNQLYPDLGLKTQG